MNFKVRDVIRDKDGQHIMIKGSIIQEDITILNVYAPNNGAFKVHEAKTDGPERRNRWVHQHRRSLKYPSIWHRQSSKDSGELNNTINQLDINDIYKSLHLARAENTFSSYGTLIKTDYIMPHKIPINKFKEQKSYNVCF